MLEKSTMTAVYKLIVLFTSMYMSIKAGNTVSNELIVLLAFTCIIITQYLIEKLIPIKPLLLGYCFIQCFVVYLIGTMELFPFLLILLVELLDKLVEDKMFYIMVMISGGILFIVVLAKNDSLFIGILLAGIYLYLRYIIEKGHRYRLLVMEQKEEISRLNQKMLDNKRLTKTLQYTAAVEERNRLATRLHDKIGHGISGSIILLEASMLMFDSDRKKSKEGILKAVNNLRDGVDDIREALREERPVQSILGMNEIRACLEQFQANHGIYTRLLTKGNLDYVSIHHFQCIHDNLNEALTNLLKHSNANEFILDLTIQNKVIRVLYKDNGSMHKQFEKDLGLDGIEERTIKCGGRCFFENTEIGFIITNIFII